MGTSHQLYLLSGRTLDEFDLPDAANVRPTDQDESRIVVPDAASGTDTAYMVDRASGERLQVLPADCTKVPLLTLMLDQGSIGTAGAAFSIFHQGKMFHPRFDKIHRVIRDLKTQRSIAWIQLGGCWPARGARPEPVLLSTRPLARSDLGGPSVAAGARVQTKHFARCLRVPAIIPECALARERAIPAQQIVLGARR